MLWKDEKERAIKPHYMQTSHRQTRIRRPAYDARGQIKKKGRERTRRWKKRIRHRSRYGGEVRKVGDYMTRF